MISEKVQLKNKQADGFVIPLGFLNLVGVVTDIGMAGCGAFDVSALDNFSYPAVRVRSEKGVPVATIEDLLSGIVKDANAGAVKLGICVGMTGREALDLM
ncbi:MAG: YunC family protein [Deltaproteobacteria bacterium]|nr:YunC family protein [Deltaproteobacteria bacterium]